MFSREVSSRETSLFRNRPHRRPGDRGEPLRAANFRRGCFAAAATAIGLPGLHPYELRHTAAGLAIASGADALGATRITARRRGTLDSAETAPRGADAQAPPPAVAPVLPKERLVDWTPTGPSTKPQVRRHSRVVPPVGFEPTLPPPEIGKGRVASAENRCFRRSEAIRVS